MESHRCSFPFSSPDSPGQLHYSCQPTNVSTSSEHYCYSQVETRGEERHVYGVCNEHCYQDDGVTPENFEDNDMMAVFCKTKPSQCQFPFIWKGKTYTECTTDGGAGFSWCALEVDQEGHLVSNRWGMCDLSTCTEPETETQTRDTGKKEARALFNGRVDGIIIFAQKSVNDPVMLNGNIGGLEGEEYTLKISKSDCDNLATGSDLGAPDVILAINNATAITDLEKYGMSLSEEEETTVVGGSVRLEDNNCEVTEDCVVARTVACANIVPGNGKVINVTLILIISLVVFCILLLILTIILVICCVKRYQW